MEPTGASKAQPLHVQEASLAMHARAFTALTLHAPCSNVAADPVLLTGNPHNPASSFKSKHTAGCPVAGAILGAAHINCGDSVVMFAGLVPRHLAFHPPAPATGGVHQVSGKALCQPQALQHKACSACTKRGKRDADIRVLSPSGGCRASGLVVKTSCGSRFRGTREGKEGRMAAAACCTACACCRRAGEAEAGRGWRAADMPGSVMRPR